MGSEKFLLLLLSLFISKCYCSDETENGYTVHYICPPSFIRLGYSCYFFSNEMETWHNAHFACRDRGSQLIALESLWEDGTIRSFLSRPEFARLHRWIGGIYDWSRQQWTWGSTASTMPYSGFGTSEVSQSFRWHCVYLDPLINYQWNHNLCTGVKHYICEVPQTRIFEPIATVV